MPLVVHAWISCLVRRALGSPHAWVPHAGCHAQTAHWVPRAAGAARTGCRTHRPAHWVPPHWVPHWVSTRATGVSRPLIMPAGSHTAWAPHTGEVPRTEVPHLERHTPGCATLGATAHWVATAPGPTTLVPYTQGATHWVITHTGTTLGATGCHWVPHTGCAPHMPGVVAALSCHRTGCPPALGAPLALGATTHRCRPH
ncbi:hypothetical protein GPJ56_004095 [Histomonas meleagridis]|nr:hypothetical protein GPJ56_004095 [Histomonas meleagridis]